MTCEQQCSFFLNFAENELTIITNYHIWDSFQLNMNW